MRRYSGLLLLPPLIAASWFSIRLARADAEFRRATPESVAQAVALAPTNIDYLLLRALQLEYDGAESSPLLARAAVLDPMNATALLRLGLAAEVQGDFASAEKNLLAAARVNRQYEPRWTLANFYFRRGDAGQFWKWIRDALDVSYGDRRPAFDLCWNMSTSADEISRLAIPRSREVAAAYVDYLNQTNRPEALAQAALQLAGYGGASDRGELLKSVDSLIAARQAAPAKRVWSALGLSDVLLFHGDFEEPEIGAGFDWRFSSAPGITHLAIEQPRSMHRILLNGNEPEAADLISQIVRLEPHARYKLTWQSRTQGIASPSGMEWRIGDQHSPVASNESGSSGEFEFIAPAELNPLVLAYRRPSGEIRAEGFIELWHLALTRDQ